MTKLLLSVHVVAAVLAVGPVAVAASMFPAVLRRGTQPEGDAVPGLRLLHRICRVYAVVGVSVPVFGLATARQMGVLGDPWLLASIALTAVAAVLLGAAVLPQQSAALAAAEEGGRAVGAGRLAMLTGVFNLVWAAVTVLMIVRPGSTTGA
ncbi:hypothetical protein [Streptomyces sulphureus]|uniref:hypothetical protein n=1 Tax=Streptomyces sulphureus TaxID=47758 RepID=UPI0003713E0F|nr:hypothetical protein [Streptomyces sulphureus]